LLLALRVAPATALLTDLDLEETSMNRLLVFLVRALVVLIVIFVLAPAVVIVVSAFNQQAFLSFPPKSYSLKWFYAALANDDFRVGFANSIWILLWSSTIAAAVGTAFSIAAHRFNFVGKTTFNAIILSPLVVPHFTIGIGILMLFVNVRMVQSFVPVIACHVILVLPFVIRSVHISLHNIEGRLELAAASLGASPRRVLWTITLPLLMPGIAGGWLFSAILSFNEFTGTVFAVSQQTRTLPVTMYNYVREHTDPTVAAVATIYIAATMFIILVVFAIFGPDRMLRTNRNAK
jgi:putative spermidine/putrescine transport system permease protein